MGIEIERKFLVSGQAWRDGACAVYCKQAYLCVGPPVAIRVRIMGDRATLNIKKAVLDITRDEFEYAIPMDDAEVMMRHLCAGHPVEKTRYKTTFDGMTWEIDEFHGANSGLIVAEIELDSPEQHFNRPPWLGEEVSADARYLNSSLSRHPFCEWA